MPETHALTSPFNLLQCKQTTFEKRVIQVFFAISNGKIQEITPDGSDEECIRVGYLTLEELKENREKLGISKHIITEFEQERAHYWNGVDVYDDFSIGVVNIVNVMNVKEARDRIGFVIQRNQFILVKLVDLDDSYKDIFVQSTGRFRQNATLEKVIYGVLERLLFNGSGLLEETERKIMKMEQKLVEGKIDNALNKRIFHLRNELSIIKNYYDQLADIGEQLQENENDLFQDEDLRYFKIFTDKTSRLMNNIQILSENLIHLREAADAYANYYLNKIMKFFTVVTTIFLPLTLIVGWYGMNFTNMPELTWKYGYIGVIILSVTVVTVCFVLFKKKKLL